MPMSVFILLFQDTIDFLSSTFTALWSSLTSFNANWLFVIFLTPLVLGLLAIGFHLLSSLLSKRNDDKEGVR